MPHSRNSISCCSYHFFILHQSTVNFTLSEHQQIETTQNTQHQTRITVELKQNESPRTVLSISTAHHRPTKPTVMESLNRPHFRSSHTGPATISLRSACFYMKHTSDLTPIMKAVVQEGRTVVTITADGGLDWSTASLLNALFFMRMWRECDLDILCVT